MLNHWPRDAMHNHFSHFTGREWTVAFEYSTIDSATFATACFIAGNYFGGEIAEKADLFFAIPDWTGTIQNSDNVAIYMNTGSQNPTGWQAPVSIYSEYIIVGAMAKRAEDVSVSTKCHDWWERFIGNDGPPSGMTTHSYPKVIPYPDNASGDDVSTLGIGHKPNHHISSFVIQFPFWNIKSVWSNPFYGDVLNNWLNGKS